MKLKPLGVATVLSLTAEVLSQDSYPIFFDHMYDQQDGSLSSVACSNGAYGLITAGYLAFGQLYTYPLVGGAPQIQSWDSPNCGTCWNLTYPGVYNVSTTIIFTAINTGAGGGFGISWTGMEILLSGGDPDDLDGFIVIASPLPATDCAI